MTEQVKTTGIKQHILRSKKVALGLSLVIASDVLFVIYGYKGDLYHYLSFWEVRWSMFILIFAVSFLALWIRERRRDTVIKRQESAK